jgi:hypothetical protein
VEQGIGIVGIADQQDAAVFPAREPGLGAPDQAIELGARLGQSIGLVGIEQRGPARAPGADRDAGGAVPRE